MRNKHASSIDFKENNSLSEFFWLIEKYKKRGVKLDKSIFTGESSLAISRILLYFFEYNYMTSKWG